MVPFVYPRLPHARRHGPRGYADYPSFRPWLRDEFVFRCAYCLRRETWGLVRGTFAIDHFLPVAVRPDLAVDYDNLVYACTTCNVAKSANELPSPAE
ncbi:MAG: HNH endonuclease, partial [Gemmataceae bacterium]|nr:HNH endonuclease [Gemmataceae bacterium]